MKHLLLTTIAAVVLVGCGPSVDIWTAAQTGNIEAVKQHLADGVDVNSKNDIGRTPLDVAIAFKQSPIADLLRQHSGKTRDELKAAESIVAAIRLGNIEAIKQHLDDGTEVNAKDENGLTPLHFAKTKEIADLLISKGADVNAKEAKNQITPLHWAAWRGRKEIAELLIAKGADVNVKNKDGGTPLHNAAWKGHVEIAKLLIVKNADVNAKDVEGQTPLDWAEEEKHKEIADLLRKHGGKTAEELKAEAAK